jgi:hypothetical protein
MTAAPAMTAAPTPEALAVIDDLRIGAIEEASDLSIPFLIGVREAARDGDVARVGACLKALWSAVLVMRAAYREIGGGA